MTTKELVILVINGSLAASEKLKAVMENADVLPFTDEQESLVLEMIMCAMLDGLKNGQRLARSKEYSSAIRALSKERLHEIRLELWKEMEAARE